MMRVYKIILAMVLCFICANCNCFAQGLYQENRKQGIQLYNNQKYDDAITRFNLAKKAPDKPAQNDIDEWIRKCNQAKQRIADERARQEAVERQRIAEQRERERQEQARQEQQKRERERDENNARKGYMEISRIQFANGPGDGTLTNDYGTNIYASEVKYLYAKAYISSLSTSERTITLHIKIFKPDGTMMKGSSSPSGYTNSFSKTIKSNSTYLLLNGWGNKNGGSYVAGQYRYEIWFQGNKLYSTNFTLHKKANEATYLKVDNKTSVSTTFDWGGDSETFYVSTDADEWTTWGVPSWCSIENKTSTSFKIRCQANNSSSTKSGNMKVKAGDKEVRIDLKQEGKPGPSASIESISQTHNVLNGFTKGMKISVKFSVSNNKGRRVTATALFYYANNTTPLNTPFGGQVSVSNSDTSPYEETTHTMSLFLPYPSLNMGPGWSGTLSFDIIIKDSSGDVLARRENNTFTYSQW